MEVGDPNLFFIGKKTTSRCLFFDSKFLMKGKLSYTGFSILYIYIMNDAFDFDYIGDPRATCTLGQEKGLTVKKSSTARSISPMN